MIKIAHLYKNYDPISSSGGVERHIRGIAKSVSKIDRSIIFSVFALNLDPKELREETPMGYQLNIVELIKKVKQQDILHIHGGRKLYTLLGSIISQVLKKPYIYTPHCYYDQKENKLKQLAKSLWDKTFEKLIIDKSYSTIYLSKYWKDYTERRIKVKDINYRIIPNCIFYNDENFIDENQIEQKKQGKILYIGRIDKDKNIDTLIKAIKIMKKKVILDIVGKGEYTKKLKELTKRLDIEDRVFFRGYVNSKKLKDYYIKSKILVLPSSFEGQPTVLMEAIRNGLEVISSNIPGSKYILDQVNLKNNTFKVNDSKELAMKLEFDNYSKNTVLSRKILRDKFCWESTYVKFSELYKEAIAESRFS